MLTVKLSTVLPSLGKAFIYVSIYCFGKQGCRAHFFARGNDFLFLKNKKLFSFRVNIFLPCQLLHINRCYNRKPSERTTSASCFKTAQLSQLSFTPAPTDPRVISSRRRSLIPVKVCCRPSSIVCLYLALSR